MVNANWNRCQPSAVMRELVSAIECVRNREEQNQCGLRAILELRLKLLQCSLQKKRIEHPCDRSWLRGNEGGAHRRRQVGLNERSRRPRGPVLRPRARRFDVALAHGCWV